MWSGCIRQGRERFRILRRRGVHVLSRGECGHVLRRGQRGCVPHLDPRGRGLVCQLWCRQKGLGRGRQQGRVQQLAHAGRQVQGWLGPEQGLVMGGTVGWPWMRRGQMCALSWQ